MILDDVNCTCIPGPNQGTCDPTDLSKPFDYKQCPKYEGILRWAGCNEYLTTFIDGDNKPNGELAGSSNFAVLGDQCIDEETSPTSPHPIGSKFFGTANPIPDSWNLIDDKVTLNQRGLVNKYLSPKNPPSTDVDFYDEDFSKTYWGDWWVS